MIIIIKFIKKLLHSTKHPSRKSAEHIIPRQQHRVSKTDISTNALKVLNRLTSANFEAYLVGGSVRDLLLGKVPKDFDIATNATPNQIRSLFRNARIIGRRFKLVHIMFQRDIIEVATFRASEHQHEEQRTNAQGILVRDNVFGSFEEDAFRRDFTINSLYYCIKNSTILDLTGGVNDIQNKTLRIIGDPSLRFQEDPVRMLRAIRFSAKLQFSIAEETAKPMYELHHLITHMSASRLFDEIVKMYQCGAAKKVQELLLQYHLFAPLFPQTNKLWQEKYPLQALLQVTLENTDSRIQDNKPVTPAFLFAALLWFPLKAHMEQLQEEGIPALVALEQAMSLVIHEQNKATAIPKRISVIMREIWLLQFRFSRRLGNRAFHLLEHPRFRAAYDFLAVRALAADAPMELADWWTRFQEEDLEAQEEMVQLLQEQSIANKKRKQAS